MPLMLGFDVPLWILPASDACYYRQQCLSGSRQAFQHLLSGWEGDLMGLERYHACEHAGRCLFQEESKDSVM